MCAACNVDGVTPWALGTAEAAAIVCVVAQDSDKAACGALRRMLRSGVVRPCCLLRRRLQRSCWVAIVVGLLGRRHCHRRNMQARRRGYACENAVQDSHSSSGTYRMLLRLAVRAKEQRCVDMPLARGNYPVHVPQRALHRRQVVKLGHRQPQSSVYSLLLWV